MQLEKKPPVKPAAKKITKQHLQHAQALGRESVERDDVETESALHRDDDDSEEEEEYHGDGASEDDESDDIRPAVKSKATDEPAEKPQGMISRQFSKVMKGLKSTAKVRCQTSSRHYDMQLTIQPTEETGASASTQETSQDPLSQMPQPTQKSRQTVLATARKQRQRAREKSASVQPESSTRRAHQPVVSPSEVQSQYQQRGGYDQQSGQDTESPPIRHSNPPSFSRPHQSSANTNQPAVQSSTLR